MSQQRFDHPALDDLYQALAGIEAAEQLLKEAKQELAETITALPAKIGDNEELRSAIVNHLYWLEDRVSATALLQAFQFRIKQQVGKKWKGGIVGSAYIEVPCYDCKQPFELEITSRSSYRSGVCPACQKKRDTDWTQQNEYWKELAQRDQELRSMPYREYLQTPEWQERRKRAMKKAGFRCQVCNAYGVRLNVHHRTYERRGHENDRDLITLCEECHTTFHENGRLAEAEA